jgi:hypothetical protein
MTTPTHGFIGYIIAISVSAINLPLGLALGSILGLLHHLGTDRLVFEWGFWYEKTLKDKILNSLIFILPFLFYGWYIYDTIYSWLFLIPIFFSVLPDFIGVQFPGHKNYQTYAKTLSSTATAFAESILAFLAILFFSTVNINWIGAIILFFVVSLVIGWVFYNSK